MGFADSQDRHQYYLAIVPPVATFCLYTFEQGRFKFLGIPGEFVEMGLNRIVSLLSGILLSSLFIFFVLVFSVRIQEGKNKIAKYFCSGLLVFLIVSPITLVSRPTLAGLVLTLVVVLGFTMSFLEEDAPVKTEQEKSDGSGIYPRHVGGMIAIFLYFSMLFFVFGHFFQSTATRWVVFKSHPNAVYVGTYGGQYLLKKVNWKDGALKPGFLLVPMDSVAEAYEVKDQKLSGKEFFEQGGPR